MPLPPVLDVFDRGTWVLEVCFRLRLGGCLRVGAIQLLSTVPYLPLLISQLLDEASVLVLLHSIQELQHASLLVPHARVHDDASVGWTRFTASV